MSRKKQVRKVMGKAKILFIEKHLFDVTLDSLIFPTGEKEPSIKAFRLEGVSLLLARSAVVCGLCPLGVPKECHEEVYEVTYEGGDSPLEQAVGSTIGKFCQDSKNTWKPLRMMCDTTSISVMGDIKAYESWIMYLKNQDLPEFDEIASVVASKLGLFIASPKHEPETFDLAAVKRIAGEEWLTDWFKQYETYRSTLKKGVCVYALPYEAYEGAGSVSSTSSKKEVEVTTLDEIFEEDLPEDFGLGASLPEKTETAITSVVSADDFFGDEDFDLPTALPTKKIDAGKLIKKAKSMGEEPTMMHATGGNPYLTMTDLDNHIQKSKAYANKVNFTPEEKQAIVDHFSFLVGKQYFHAIELARKEGMELMVERIEGFAKNKFPNERAHQLRVTVRDPRPVTSVYPSEEGIVVSVNGLVGM